MCFHNYLKSDIGYKNKDILRGKKIFFLISFYDWHYLSGIEYLYNNLRFLSYDTVSLDRVMPTFGSLCFYSISLSVVYNLNGRGANLTL